MALKTQTDSTSTVLDRILREAWAHHLAGDPFLAVFDLDSTLFDLTLRVATIVDDFACDPGFQARFPKETKALAGVEILPNDWGLGEPLERLGIGDTTHPEFCQALHEHWAHHFFSDRYLHHDEPLPGSVEYVSELLHVGADLMYLTGRDVARFWDGTERSLRECGFPVNSEKARMVLKPEARMDDAQFKVDVLRSELTKYKRIWLFENEPVNLNLTAKNLPEVGLVFIDSTHSGREQVAPTLDAIRHFETDLGEFRKFRSNSRSNPHK